MVVVVVVGGGAAVRVGVGGAVRTALEPRLGRVTAEMEDLAKRRCSVLAEGTYFEE